MEEEIIKINYSKSVIGLNELILADKTAWYNYIINLPRHLQVVYTTVILHQQVLNGGFHQYFFNPYGQFAYLTVENLKEIMAFKTAEILVKALNAVNADQYDIDKFRDMIFNRQIMAIVNFDDKLGDLLNNLDSEYYSLDENLETLLAGYLKNNL